MQRCPYIHEMKERLLGQPVEQLAMEPLTKDAQDTPPTRSPAHLRDPPIGTVVRLNADGYGSHTSPTHQCTPLVPHEPEDDFYYTTETRTRPKNAKTSLFIIMSFIYAKLLVVICIAYVIADGITHSLPLYYYEGFFTYLYGLSIVFLLYVFCFLLPDCHSDSERKPPKEKIVKPPKEEKKKKEDKKAKDAKKDKGKDKDKEKEKDKDKDKEKEKDKTKDKDAAKAKRHNQFQLEMYPRKMRDVVRLKEQQEQIQQMQELLAEARVVICSQSALRSHGVAFPLQDNVDLEAAVSTRGMRKRKTTQNDSSHGSFFLRIGAIAFGLGTMIYNGLELGAEFEVPMKSPCYEILRVVNPILQMLFTFMQMYFIFLNSRVNILRFKVIARFGLMHICATNICVWIRTLVLEYLKEITAYHQSTPASPNDGLFAGSMRQYTRLNAGKIFGTEKGGYASAAIPTSTLSTTTMGDTLRSTARVAAAFAAQAISSTTQSSTTISTIPTTLSTTTPSTTTTTTTPIPTTISTTLATEPTTVPTTTSTLTPTTEWVPPIESTIQSYLLKTWDNYQGAAADPQAGNMYADSWQQQQPQNETFFNDILPAALSSVNETLSVVPVAAQSCGRVNIMGTFVKDSAPYLYPFIIEYSLIGAAVIYVMWKNIGRNPRYVSEEDLEHRLEVMLSRRAVAMAHAQHGRVDCVGASKGLFFGLLLLVGSLICLILFFVLIHHPELNKLAIYLADVSHCALMVLSIIAIIIGFIRSTKLRSIYDYRVQHLKFRAEEQSDLNDILLRVSAFGLFTYAVFSVIAGSLNAFTQEPNLLVMVTGILSILQVVLQLLFIADVARRRVHLPEHDRSKPGRQVVTFLLICNVTMWIIYTFEMQKVEANPVQLDFYGFATWAIIQRITLPLCIFHRFHSAVTLAEIWKTSYKARLE